MCVEQGNSIYTFQEERKLIFILYTSFIEENNEYLIRELSALEFLCLLFDCENTFR